MAFSARPGEHVPTASPVLISNTKAAGAALARGSQQRAATDRPRSIFSAIWLQGLHLSGAYEARRLVTQMMGRRKTLRTG